MKKSKLEIEIENALARVKGGMLSAKQLRTKYVNVKAMKDLTEQQTESLVEVIETQLWKDYPREAKKRLGPRNSETRQMLEIYFDEIQKSFDLSENHHKNKVKLGGNVISGEALIYDYISYRNKDTKMIAHMAIRKLNDELPVEIVVTKHTVGESGNNNLNTRIFNFDKFGESTKVFEKYLASVLAGAAD